MKANQLFEHLIAKNNLDLNQMQEVIRSCIHGAFTDIQIATFLALMRAKGETVEELYAAAVTMQGFAHAIDLGPNLIDIVGTGGDKKNTFNVSTASCFVVASCGIPVAKHGNRAMSSNSGSADVLEKAGFKLNLNPEQLQLCIKVCNLAFLFAQDFHPAMKSVSIAREQLGIRTLFNLLGPLLNPARVTKQVVGVYSATWLQPLAQVLSQLGSKRCLVLSAEDGLDEISIVAPTKIIEFKKGQFNSWVIHPKDFKLHHPSLDELIVESPQQSQAMIQGVLEGKNGGAKDIVLLNAAAAIYCFNENISFEAALGRATIAIEKGHALQFFNRLRLLTQYFNSESHE